MGGSISAPLARVRSNAAVATGYYPGLKLAVRVALFSELNRRSGVLIPRHAMPRARALSCG